MRNRQRHYKTFKIQQKRGVSPKKVSYKNRKDSLKQSSNSSSFEASHRKYVPFSVARILIFLLAISGCIQGIGKANATSFDFLMSSHRISNSSMLFGSSLSSYTMQSASSFDVNITPQVLPCQPISFISNQTSFALFSTASSPTFMGLPVKKIKFNPSACDQKSSGVNEGKVCVVGGDTFFLKAVAAERYHDNTETNLHLRAKYNLLLLDKLIGIHVPEIHFFYEKGGNYTNRSGGILESEFYSGSLAIRGYTSIGQFHEAHNNINHDARLKQLLKKNRQFSSDIPLLRSIMFRSDLEEKIGKDGIAKLAIAGTLISDLISNYGNWGYDQNGLVIIDADTSPETMNDYLDNAAKVPIELVDNQIYLTVHDLKKMIVIYNDMLNKTLPKLHPNVDLSQELFVDLISRYIHACETALNNIERISPKVKEDQPSRVINAELTSQFSQIKTRLTF